MNSQVQIFFDTLHDHHRTSKKRRSVLGRHGAWYTYPLLQTVKEQATKQICTNSICLGLFSIGLWIHAPLIKTTCWNYSHFDGTWTWGREVWIQLCYKIYEQWKMASIIIVCVRYTIYTNKFHLKIFSNSELGYVIYYINIYWLTCFNCT